MEGVPVSSGVGECGGVGVRGASTMSGGDIVLVEVGVAMAMKVDEL